MKVSFNVGIWYPMEGSYWNTLLFFGVVKANKDEELNPCSSYLSRCGFIDHLTISPISRDESLRHSLFLQSVFNLDYGFVHDR